MAAGGARRRGLRVAQYERCRLATVMGKAIAPQPTHLCEMGADITTLLHQRGEFGNIVAGLEATGSGVNRLGIFSGLSDL